jgi:sulfite exporter TauE/SafE/copper chaperone CopZ
MNTKTIPIKGMHCKSCEILIEDELKNIEGVKEVDISHRTGEATLHFEGNRLDHADVEHAVKAAGYELGTNEELPLFSRNIGEYIELGLGIIVVSLLSFIIKELGLFDVAMGASNNFQSLPIVLLVGLTAGVSTCMALVGGLVLGVAGRYVQDNPQATIQQKFIPHLYFNLGRIISFFVLGGVAGLIGSFFQISATFMGILIILVGISMIYLGLQLIHIFPRIAGSSITLPKWISKSLGISTHQDSYSHKGALLLGALTFFVPCGFTQAIQLFAMSTSSFITGGLTMLVFAIGTTPGLLSLGGLTSFIKGTSTGFFFKLVGLIVIAMAVFNISNGLSLAGLKNSKNTQIQIQENDPNVKMEKGVQVVRMEQNARGYSPDIFTVKKGIPVKWIIKSVYPSCASSLMVEKLNIRTLLTEKEQEFNFTPKESGEIPFSCSMGMYSGTIIVQ